MSTAIVAVVVSGVVGLLLAETRVSRQQEQVLRARGAIEPVGDPYVWLSALYPTAFVAMGLEGFWRVAAAGPAVGSGRPSWLASGVLLFVASKALKYWAIAHLGDRWSFRILVMPGAPLVASGPYRYVRHPNYVAVFGELLGMMLMMSAWMTGPAFTIAFALALRVRVRVEERALSAQPR